MPIPVKEILGPETLAVPIDEEIKSAIQAAEAESLNHATGCNCVFCFSRRWDKEHA